MWESSQIFEPIPCDSSNNQKIGPKLYYFFFVFFVETYFRQSQAQNKRAVKKVKIQSEDSLILKKIT